MAYTQSHPARTKYKTNEISNGTTVKSDEKVFNSIPLKLIYVTAILRTVL